MKTYTDSGKEQQIRILPGVIIVIIQWIARFLLPRILPETLQAGVFAGMLGGIAVIIWWVFFSRASRTLRWSAPVVMITMIVITPMLLDKSLATANMGLMFYIFSIPVLSLAFVAWALISSRFSKGFRLFSMIVTIMASTGFWTLLRSEGMNGELQFDFAWRWSETSETSFLKRNKEAAVNDLSDNSWLSKEAEWPGFRGKNRDAVVHGTQFSNSWAKSSPKLMWRRAVGPACSSVAIHGSRLYTQEQRGDLEIVSCYNLNTGKEIWVHSDSARFWDSHAGAGPRSTPTLSDGIVYTLGATGILNALDERDGSVKWTVNVADKSGVKLPGWGYASSPLIVDSLVFASISGKIFSYNSKTGKLLWAGTDGGECYSSPHLLTINGKNQVLFHSNASLSGFDPGTGVVLWQIKQSGGPILQPAIIDGNDILIGESTSVNMTGVRRLRVSNSTGKWEVSDLWKSDKFKPNFNDFVINNGYAFGFEGLNLVCINLKNGQRAWRGGRYGGQLFMLADQDLLLIISERGDLALVEADTTRYKECSRMPAIKGKTWNHPALAGSVIVVRNSLEMAAFRLPENK